MLTAELSPASMARMIARISAALPFELADAALAVRELPLDAAVAEDAAFSAVESGASISC